MFLKGGGEKMKDGKPKYRKRTMSTEKNYRVIQEG